MEPDNAAARKRFEELFDAYYAELTRFASRRVGAGEAADIVASTFLIAWRRLAELPTDQARAWLYTTARGVIANEMRGRARRDRLTAKAAGMGGVGGMGGIGTAHVADHSGQVDEQLRVRAVFAQLSPADQEVLRLIEWEGLKVAEAATVLRCSRTALKVRLHRARRRFAHRLQAAEDRDPVATRRFQTSIFPGGSTSS